MRTEQDYNTVDAMEEFGGSFVKALSACFRRADMINFEKLKACFPEYWQQYTDMSLKIRSKSAYSADDGTPVYL